MFSSGVELNSTQVSELCGIDSELNSASIPHSFDSNRELLVFSKKIVKFWARGYPRRTGGPSGNLGGAFNEKLERTSPGGWPTG